MILTLCLHLDIRCACKISFSFLWSIPVWLYCTLSVLLSMDIYTVSSFSSVQFSRSVVSHSLQPNKLQHTRPPRPSPTPGVHSNSCPLCRWCHPVISSSVVPFSGPQSFPASGSFPMSQFFVSGGQSIEVSASASVLPMNSRDWFPLGLTSLRTPWTVWKGKIQLYPNTKLKVFFKKKTEEESLHLWGHEGGIL